MIKKSRVFINRELSWLSFNDRVLQEAQDKTTPLIERLKFLGIYSNNRDEFFRVRVATLKRIILHQKKGVELMGEKPEILLEKIQKTVIKQQRVFESTYQTIIKELKKHNITFIDETHITKNQGAFVKNYFREKVMPTLFPIILDNTPTFPYLKDKSGYLIISLEKRKPILSSEKTATALVEKIKRRYALIEVPSDVLSRFLVLPREKENNFVILLDDVIRYCLDDVFQNFDYDKIEAYNIKLTRDAEIDIDNDISKSLVEKISKGIKARKKGQPVRLVYDSAIPNDMLEFIMKKTKLGKEDNPIPGGKYHNFKDFISFPNIGGPELTYKKTAPLKHPELINQKSIFKVVHKKDILLTYPYQSFEHIIDFLREASIDPKVKTIKITLYRVAKNSNVVKALINAIKNGKQVIAVVELRARFDEEANIAWANKLQEEGAIVIYGVPNLKVHSKLFLITRKENNKLVNYAHIGTGNFNGDTAKIYTDHSLLTADKRITNEIEDVFTYYLNNTKPGNYKHLLTSPFFMRKQLTHLINNEIKNAAKKKPASISLKLNNLVDDEMIKKLYAASKAGVKIKIIVRGICSLVPGIKGLSENIEVISIVDKFLEHSRLFIFGNDSEEKYYFSSADWMTRNLDHRSEVAVPIYDKTIQSKLKSIYNIMWADNTKARIINAEQTNKYRPKKGKEETIRSQEKIYTYFKYNKL